MVSKSIRSSDIPDKIIVMWRGTSLPTNFTHLSSTNCKFIKVVNSVDPNTTSGSSTHTHTSSAHSHTTSGIGSHDHPGSSTNGSSPTTGGNYGGYIYPLKDHSHSLTIGSNSGSVSAATDSGHTHDTGNNDPVYKTIRYIKHSKLSVSMRSKNLPKDSLTIWSKTTSIPTNHNVFSGNDGYHIKGNTTADSTGGSNTHQHASESGTSHSLSGGAHSHTLSVNAISHPLGNTQDSPPSSSMAQSQWDYPSHTHTSPVGSFPSSGSVSGSTPTSSPHQHNSLSNEPPYINIHLISSIISMRVTGIQKSVSVEWEDTLSSIPSGLQLADGTNGTTDLRTKYLKPSATCIGATGGSSSHEHDSLGSHDHGSFPVSHSHSASITTTGWASPPSNGGAGGGGGVPRSRSPHTHSITTTSSQGVCVTTSAGGGHTHGSQTHTPPTLELAVIEKL